MTTHVVIRENGLVLVDRATMARLIGRSVNTIRARCEMVRHHTDRLGRTRALYDLEKSEALLLGVRIRHARRAA